MPEQKMRVKGDKAADAGLVMERTCAKSGEDVVYGIEPLWYIGLLTDAQKHAGYFVAQDYDFIHLFCKDKSGIPRCVAVFLYETARVKEIRDAAEADQALP